MDLNWLLERFKSISSIHDNNNKVSFIWMIISFFCVLIMLILSTSSYAKDDSITLNTLLSTNTNKDEMIVLFHQDLRSFDSINQVGIHYLESVDCQTGWLGYYETPFEPVGFSINHATVFGLRADAVYRAGRENLNGSILVRTKSILIKFTGNNGHFANFALINALRLRWTKQNCQMTLNSRALRPVLSKI